MGVLNRLKTIDFDHYKLKVQEIPAYFIPEELYEEEILEFMNRMANYKLNEDELQVINDAILELAIRLGDLDTFKEYFNKARKFDFRTPFFAIESYHLSDIAEFKHYLEEDDEDCLNSPLYNELFEEIGSPLKKEEDDDEDDEFILDERPLELEENKGAYFDHLIMLFVVALEGRDLSKYIQNLVFSWRGSGWYKDYEIIERAAVLGKVNIVKYLLEQGAEVPEYTCTQSEEIKSIFDSANNAEINSKWEQNFHPAFANSPAFSQISEWIKQYEGIYYVTADFTRKYNIILLSNDEDIFEFMKMDKKYYGESLFLVKKSDAQDILEFENQKGINNRKLYNFFENSILYKNKDPKEGSLEAFLHAATTINKMKNYVSHFIQPEYREHREGDVWAQVYEDQKEYNDNH
jgi:hypothetical protein